MPATFKPELKTAPRQDGTCAIRIRITKFRKHAYWNVGKNVLPSNWNPKPKPHLSNWVLKHDDAPQINNAIKNALKGLSQFADQLPAATAAQIKEAYEAHLNPQPEAPEVVKGFVPFMFEFVEQARIFSENTAENYLSVARIFQKYLPPKASDAEILSRNMLLKFIQQQKKEGKAASTINNQVAFLSTVYSRGVKQGRIDSVGVPFDGLKLSVPEKKRDRPTAEQVEQFMSYLPPFKHQVKAKQAAMLQYYCHGARISEALTLEWGKNVFPDRIEYTPKKRGTRLKVIARTPQLNNLLKELPRKSRYVLPYLKDEDANLPPDKMRTRIVACTVLVNRGLRRISEALGFGIELSSHMFRHSLADKIMKKKDSITSVKEILGQKTFSAAENYVKGLSVGEVLEESIGLYLDEGNKGEHWANNLCRTVQAEVVMKKVKKPLR